MVLLPMRRCASLMLVMALYLSACVCVYASRSSLGTAE